MRTADEEAPPLLSVTGTGGLDGRSDLLVGLAHILRDLLALLINVDHGCFLLCDENIHVLVQLGELDHLSLDLRNRLVAIRDLAKNRLRLSATITLQELKVG